MSGWLPSAVVLGALAVAALWLTVSRGAPSASGEAVRSAARAAVLAVAMQAAHFAEEAVTGLDEHLPAVFGLEPMAGPLFVTFNVAWLAIWAASAWGLLRRSHAALFALWFLGLGCVTNGLAHPLLALRSAGYFPGLATSPLVAAIGALLLRRLVCATR